MPVLARALQFVEDGDGEVSAEIRDAPSGPVMSVVVPRWYVPVRVPGSRPAGGLRASEPSATCGHGEQGVAAAVIVLAIAPMVLTEGRPERRARLDQPADR
ncbi:hypothetical protein [Micromonospora sp. NPDC005171]|uniref:hypothetical protein n=1 Tax=Micromonospora sp. NPDC005171 TaxID=3156866 RepID=UPI0033AB731D